MENDDLFYFVKSEVFDLTEIVEKNCFCNFCKKENLLNSAKDQFKYFCPVCKISFCEKCVNEKLSNPENKGLSLLIHPEHNLCVYKITRMKTLKILTNIN